LAAVQVGGLAAAEDSLRDVRDRLGERIHERAAELTTANAALQAVTAAYNELGDMLRNTREDIAKRIQRDNAELAKASAILRQEIARDKSAEEQIRKLDENLEQLVTKRTVVLHSSPASRNGKKPSA
jgi:chromosome segregation ATPase